jgi:hypothetical protein
LAFAVKHRRKLGGLLSITRFVRNRTQPHQLPTG